MTPELGSRSMRQKFFGSFFQKRTPFFLSEGTIGAAMLAALALIAIAAPILSPGDPQAIGAPPLLRPFVDAAHPLGTDRLGRDLLAGLIHGAGTTLMVALSAAATALGIGIAVGVLAGFLGGWVDDVLMRITEAFQTIPAFLLTLALVSITGPAVTTIAMGIALGAWMQPARIARAEVMSLRERDFVAAARVIGMGGFEIAFREILPHALPPVISLGAVIVAASVLIESALSFLGLGDPNHVTWGGMIAEGRPMLRSAAYLSVIPGLALVTTVLAIHLAGRGLARAMRIRPAPMP